MNKLIIILLFIFSFTSYAEENCTLPIHVLPPIVVSAVDISEQQCTEELEDSYLDYAVGCLSGGWKAGASAVEGIVELTKLLLIDAPQWIWNETKKKINEIRQQNLSPLEMVKAVANVQVASHSDIFNKAQEYWDTFLQFSKNLKDTLVSEIKGFPCLPNYQQSEIICQGVTNVFLTVFTPAAFINGARWSASTAKAVASFAKESKKIHGLEDASFAERLNKVTDYLKGRAVGEKVSVAGGFLREVELPTGEKVLQFTKEVKGKDGKLHTITREVPVDAKTKGIDANTEIGKEILRGMVSSLEGKGSVVFVDVNHLGKVNYFAGGTQTGDKYLVGVSEALQKSLRPGDFIFKNGGDELVVVLKNNDPKVVKSISQRMVHNVDSHPEVKSIFRNEVKQVSEQYRKINNVNHIDGLPESVTANLSQQELELARQNFALFKQQKLIRLNDELIDQASYRGSVSVGTSLIRTGDDLASTLSRAELQASKVKAEYKQRLGHDISKYNITPEEFSGIRKWSPPQVLDPD